MLIAVEGIDQAGKGTQTALLAEALRARGRRVETVAFPDYGTPIGREIGAFLHGRTNPPTETRHLLFAANRYERRADLLGWLASGTIVLADRYGASGVAYGMAAGLPREWLTSLEARLPEADRTILLDADPAGTRGRLAREGDLNERDLALLERCRAAYRELAGATTWIVLDAHESPEAIHRRIIRHLAAALAL